MSVPRGRLLHFAAWGGGAVVLALVFMAYLDPHTMVDLSNRVWSCIG